MQTAQNALAHLADMPDGDLGYAPAALADLRRFCEISDDAEQIAAVSPIVDALGQQPLKLH